MQYNYLEMTKTRRESLLYCWPTKNQLQQMNHFCSKAHDQTPKHENTKYRKQRNSWDPL